MNGIQFVGIDLAKNIFQVHGVDASGRPCLKRRVGRAQLRDLFAHMQPCTIGIEACNSAHFWARELKKLGHTVNDGTVRFFVCEAVKATRFSAGSGLRIAQS